ncbi:MAG TPA: hypothetical protein VGF31_06050, partial [Myxococcaceae bacterium]
MLEAHAEPRSWTVASPVSRRVLASLVPPLLVFGAVRLLLVEAARAAGYDAWSAISWRRFDSVHYLGI